MKRIFNILKPIDSNKIESGPGDHQLLLKDHFKELVNRFYFWLFFFSLGMGIGYFNYPVLLGWLIKPLNKPLFYTSPTGGVDTVFNVAASFGFLFSLPVLTYQVIKFVEPAIPKLTKKKILLFLVASSMLAFSGVLVSYYIVFPATIKFLNEFGANQLESLISTKDYFSFIFRYLFGFAIFFQFPLFIFMINLFRPVTAKLLISKFSYVIAVSLVIAAILTPTPDMLNQFIMAAPLVILYLLTILIVWLKTFIFKSR